ncbi:MAG: HYR domain-containing protein [Flavobacteriaceae bacterium]
MKKITFLWQLAILVFFSSQLTAQRFYSSGEREDVQVTAQTKLEIENAKRNFSSRSSANTSPQMMASTYVGSFLVGDGPSWTTNPPSYTAQEAAALIFGGSPSDYFISTNPNTVDPMTITHTAWTDSWGGPCQELAEDFKIDVGAVGYNDPGGVGTATSAYINDHPSCWPLENFVWLAGPAPITACGPNGLPIDNPLGSNCTALSPATVAGGTVIGSNIGEYRLSNVTIDIVHTWDSDLDISLQSPSGTILDLSSDNGGSGDNYQITVFEDGAPVITTGSPPFNGTFEPEGGTFASTFAGESINGNWTLIVSDDVCSFDGGTLNSYCITFEPILVIGDPPVISCPANITADNAAGQCGAVVNFAAVAVDTEDGNISGSIVYTPDTGSFFPVGTTTVTASVTDSDGNTATCTFDVTVVDAEDPAVTCADFTAQLDASGMVTVLPSDVASATDNCPGVTLDFLISGVPGPSDIITTLFNRNNGGNFGGAVYFDVTVGPADIQITDLETNTAETGAMTMDVYTLIGTSVGNQQNPAPWTLMATGSGTGAGLNNPSMLALDNPIILSANTTYGFALVMDASHGHDYSGTGTNPAPGSTSYSNADLTLSLGSANNTPFSSAAFTPRIWNGSLIYQPYTSVAVPSLDYTCMEVGPNDVTVIATDAAGNTSTCTAVVTVEDNIAPVIACIGAPGIMSVTEDFEGASLPAGWSTVIVSGGFDWTFGSGVMPGGAPFSSNAAIFDDDAAGSGELDNTVQLLSPVVDLSMSDSADLSFDYSMQAFVDSGTLTAEVWDGAAWQQILFVDVDTDPTNTGVIDMTSFMNAAFQVRFTYDDENDWAWGAGVDNFILNYNVPSIPYDAILDGTTGTVTVNMADLLLSVDEACSYTVTTGGGAPVPGSITTLFDSNNGGSNGGAIYYDLTVGPQDITLTDIDINTDEPGAFTMDVFTLVGTYVGNTGNAGAWTLATSSSGTASGTLNVPSNAVLDTPLVLTANTTYGIALVLDASHGHSYSGTGSDPSPGNTNYSNADLALELGAATNAPFDGSPFSPRVFNGTLNYLVGEPSSTTIEFDCDDLGLNQVEVTVTDASGNTSTCTATVNVIDNTDPILVCMDATVSLDQDGMASILPSMFIDTANSFDACGITITAVDVTDVTCDDIGTPITVTVFASDASGNLASCTATLTVVDDLGPVIEGCPADHTVDPGPLNLFYELPDYWGDGGITADDNCTDPVTIFSQSPAPGTLLPDGVYTISICATDEYGNEGCCTFELTVESILGTDDVALDNAIAMYPNPTDGQVTIANTSNIQLEKAVIYDANGRLVQQVDLRGMATERTFNVSSLASGVYMVQIQSESAQTVKRLIRR